MSILVRFLPRPLIRGHYRLVMCLPFPSSCSYYPLAIPLLSSYYPLIIPLFGAEKNVKE